MSRYDEDMCEAISIATLNVQQDISSSFICCKLIAQQTQHRTSLVLLMEPTLANPVHSLVLNRMEMTNLKETLMLR